MESLVTALGSWYSDTNGYHAAKPITSLVHKPQLIFPPQLPKSQPMGTIESWREDITGAGSSGLLKVR